MNTLQLGQHHTRSAVNKLHLHSPATRQNTRFGKMVMFLCQMYVSYLIIYFVGKHIAFPKPIFINRNLKAKVFRMLQKITTDG